MPPCHYIAKSARAQYKHRKFFATGADLDHDGVEKIWQGGGGGLFLLFYVQNFECTFVVGKKSKNKKTTRGGFFGLYDS